MKVGAMMLATPVVATIGHQNTSVPWMCDCVGNAEHCRSGQSQAETDACALYVRIAQAFGYSADKPGERGSLMNHDPILSRSVGNFCSWGIGGLICDCDLPGCVTYARWTGNNVQGTIPAELNEWKGLNTLYLDGLTGTIPELNLPNLADLQLENDEYKHNQLSGPFIRGHLPNLWRLNLAGNQLTGTLPHGLDKTMPQLGRLYVQDNQFTGPIPYDIPFFNQTDLPSGSVICDFSGNEFDCAADYVRKGPYYHCKVSESHCDADLVV